MDWDDKKAMSAPVTSEQESKSQSLQERLAKRSLVSDMLSDKGRQALQRSQLPSQSMPMERELTQSKIRPTEPNELKRQLLSEALEKADVVPPSGFKSSDGGPTGGHLRKSQQHLIVNSSQMINENKAKAQQEMHQQVFRESMPPHIQAQMQQQERKAAPERNALEPRFQTEREAVLYNLGVQKGQMSSGEIAAGGGFLYGAVVTLCAVGIVYCGYRVVSYLSRPAVQAAPPIPHQVAVPAVPNAAIVS